jgi:hypothetical protein
MVMVSEAVVVPPVLLEPPVGYQIEVCSFSLSVSQHPLD